MSQNLLRNSESIIRKSLIEKGFPDATAKITAEADTSFAQAQVLRIDVEQGPRLRIDDIVFEGNTALSGGKLRRAMDELHRLRWWNIFQSA
ncbi:MAG: hypothetical protein RL558_503, partial [Bacteroidota bacterium]